MLTLHNPVPHRAGGWRGACVSSVSIQVKAWRFAPPLPREGEAYGKPSAGAAHRSDRSHYPPPWLSGKGDARNGRVTLRAVPGIVGGMLGDVTYTIQFSCSDPTFQKSVRVWVISGCVANGEVAPETTAWTDRPPLLTTNMSFMTP
jgi:hypothetical protein